MASSATLALHLDALARRVAASASAGFADEFSRLGANFPTWTHLGALDALVELEDFLSHLNALRTWPSTEVSWDPPLAELVRTNWQDAQSLDAQLDTQVDRDVSRITIPLSIDEWYADLKDFQIRDATRLLQLSHGANFSVPGAGKTRVALAVYNSRRLAGQVKRLLVVAPKSAFEAWREESLTCLQGKMRFTTVSDSSVVGDALLINYERLPQNLPSLARWLREGEAMMIVDEGHRMKLGPGGVYGRAVLALAPLAKHRLVLTGTPAPNGVADLQNVMSFPWPGSGKVRVLRATQTPDLHQASAALKPLFVRTTKSELNLPPCEPKLVPIELPPLHLKVYRALQGHFAAEAPELTRLGRIALYLLMAGDCPALIPLGTTPYEPLNYVVPPLEPEADLPLRDLMRNLPGYEVSPKFLEATRICTRNAEAGKKTVVWSTFVRSLLSLERLMAPLQPALVHGGTPDREQVLARFRDDPDCHVLLSNPATLGEGISLHKTSTNAVYVDRDFAAGRYLQSVDRVHRLGLSPDAEVSVTVLCAKGTIDEIVESRLSDKLRFMSAVLDDPDIQQLADLDEDPAVGAGLSPDDLQAIVGHLRRGA